MLPPAEARALGDLADLIQQEIPIVGVVAPGRAEWRVGSGLAAYVPDDHVRALVVRDAGLRELPESLAGMRWLEELDLGENVLTGLPDWIGDLVSLRQLLVHENALQELPDSLADLQALRLLDVGHNPALRALPDGLPPLEFLYAAEIGLTAMPPVPSLLYLGIGHNDLDELPPAVCGCRELRTLNVRANHLTSLPEELRHLRNLVELDARANRLRALPAAFSDMPALRKLDLRWNGFATKPPEAQGVQLVYV